VEVKFCFQPPQPFGLAASGGRTAVKGKVGSVTFNSNTGQCFVENIEPLAPLRVTLEEPGRRVSVRGSILTINQRFESFPQLREMLDSVGFALPMLLAVEFADPPWLEEVTGLVGSVPFRWQLALWRFDFPTTTQEDQQRRVVTSLRRLVVLAADKQRRLVGAVHYFHIACRLRREEKTAGEFLAEALHNLCKVLENLYGPEREDVRAALRVLRYRDEEIERDFIPVMLLRNSFDVGHPSLVVFTDEQLETLHRYADRAETVFRRFLQKLLEGIEAGWAAVPDYQLRRTDAQTARTLEMLRERMAGTP
jgi:hypothetical protein